MATDAVSTTTAVGNAGNQGATHVTINIYQQARCWQRRDARLRPDDPRRVRAAGLLRSDNLDEHIHSPSLTLTFLGGDLEQGTLVQTIGKEQSQADDHLPPAADDRLKSASNQVDLLLDKACPAIEDIIATEGDVKASSPTAHKPCSPDTCPPATTGRSATAESKRLRSPSEDTGTRLLGKAFIESGRHLFNCTASEAIASICTRAGIHVSPDCISLTDRSPEAWMDRHLRRAVGPIGV